MKNYFVDTNVFLRYTLKDDLISWKKADNYFKEAKKGNLHLIFLSEIILEIEYVLRKLYSLPRTEIQRNLLMLINTPDIEIRNREILRLAINHYAEKSVDLLDLLIFFSAKNENADILSFDKDFKKIARIVRSDLTN